MHHDPDRMHHHRKHQGHRQQRTIRDLEQLELPDHVRWLSSGNGPNGATIKFPSTPGLFIDTTVYDNVGENISGAFTDGGGNCINDVCDSDSDGTNDATTSARTIRTRPNPATAAAATPRPTPTATAPGLRRPCPFKDGGCSEDGLTLFIKAIRSRTPWRTSRPVAPSRSAPAPTPAPATASLPSPETASRSSAATAPKRPSSTAKTLDEGSRATAVVTMAPSSRA